MGLTNSSTGVHAADSDFVIDKKHPTDHVVALAGNPNVGKSTLFNGLTGLHQHTGNWTGKTVSTAQGYYSTSKNDFVLVDIPGTYSLMARSIEEEVARNFICFGGNDGVVVVCDATCLERNLNLVIQTLELTPNVLLCVNLMDEAKRKGISLDTQKLSNLLGVSVVSISAQHSSDLQKVAVGLDDLVSQSPAPSHYCVRYSAPIEGAIALLETPLRAKIGDGINPRWLALRLLEVDTPLLHALKDHLGFDILDDEEIVSALERANDLLLAAGLDSEGLSDAIVTSIMTQATEVSSKVVTSAGESYSPLDRKLDRFLTSRLTGYPILLALLTSVFWLTIAGANIPSSMLADGLFWLQDRLTEVFHYFGAPDWLHGVLVLGVYRVLAWVVSVMLPPMAIFFPLFTLLEDGGYLPRVAYMLDKPFQRCSACGKQSLTMAMGLGCNAAGIIGCRIIDSPRERLLAILTNNFIPCNGRLPPPSPWQYFDVFYFPIFLWNFIAGYVIIFEFIHLFRRSLCYSQQNKFH